MYHELMKLTLMSGFVILILYVFLFQQSRMEERLDDAIHVLRNHAESSQIFGPPGQPGMPPMMSPTHSNGLMPPHPHSMPHGAAPPYTTMPPYDPHMVSVQKVTQTNNDSSIPPEENNL